jgi:hypothetical protein
VDAYTSSEVNLVDKVVRVAYPQPANAVVDAASLDGAGLALADESTANYEKSLKWRSGPGGSPSASNESYWDLRGGHVRLSAPATANRAVSYGMRVNEREELEIYKLVSSAGAELYQRVFTMGADVSSPGFTLPVSANPFYTP